MTTEVLAGELMQVPGVFRDSSARRGISTSRCARSPLPSAGLPLQSQGLKLGRGDPLPGSSPQDRVADFVLEARKARAEGRHNLTVRAGSSRPRGFSVGHPRPLARGDQASNLYTRRRLADPAINCSRVGGVMKGSVAAELTTAGAVAVPSVSSATGVHNPNCFA